MIAPTTNRTGEDIRIVYLLSSETENVKGQTVVPQMWSGDPTIAPGSLKAYRSVTSRRSRIRVPQPSRFRALKRFRSTLQRLARN